MSKVSTVRKVGVTAKVAREQIARSRTFRAIVGAVRTTARSFLRAAHQLWLEVIGTVFLVMAAFGGTALVREYAKRSGHTSVGRVVAAICFTLAFGWFGVSSFWKARRNGRQGM